MVASKERVQALSRRVADEVARVEGVVAVVLGGSHASGLATPESDLDIGIYYANESELSVEALQRVGTALQGGRSCEVATPGEWGEWMNGGSWLQIENTRVDLILRDLNRVQGFVEECISGWVTTGACLGYPHGFHSHYYAAEVHFCEPLLDPGHQIAALRRRLTPFPPRLRQALIEKFLYEAGFTIDVGENSARQGDVHHAVGCVSQCVAALIQVIFALNERFTMNEKKSLRGIRGLPIQPASFESTVQGLLGGPGSDVSTLRESYAKLRVLLDSVRALAPRLSYSWPPS